MLEDSFIRLSFADNVLVLPCGGRAGDLFGGLTLRNEIPPCHKVAAEDISAGEPVIKYGRIIGFAARDTVRGDWIHDHNMYSKIQMRSTPELRWSGPYPYDRGKSTASFMGYRRRGKIRPGIRNELWVIPTAGCITGELKYILSQYRKPYWIDCVRTLDCQFTCEESLCPDFTADMALGLARNPNAAGVLLVGLGCDVQPRACRG